MNKMERQFKEVGAELLELMDKQIKRIADTKSILDSFPTGTTNCIPARLEKKLSGSTLMIWGSNCKEHTTWLVESCDECKQGEWVEILMPDDEHE